MANFLYKAIDKKRGYVKGIVQAPTLELAASILLEKDIFIVSLTEQERGILSLPKNFFRSVSLKDLVIFSRQLSILVSANVPLVQALRILVQQTGNKKFKFMISEVGDDVEGGAKLSNSLAKHPNVFDDFFVSIIRSGETSGKLDDVLLYLADQQEKDYDLMTKIRGAMIYPLFILAGLGMIGAIMMMFVVPKITSILAEVGAELPLSTKILIGVSNFLKGYWWALMLGFVFLFVIGRIFTNTQNGQKIFDTIKLRIPVLGKLFQRIIIVRFSRSLKTLIEGGVPLPKSLKIASDVAGNEVYKDIIIKTIREVEDGNPIASVFMKRKEVPVMVSQMLNIGEKTGRLSQILEKITEFYTREIENLVRNLVTLIEPLTIVLIGVAVGVMIAAIILPIYNLSSSL